MSQNLEIPITHNGKTLQLVNAYMDVIEIVKAKLSADKLPTDLLIAIYAAEVEQAIKTYCNREDIPTELLFVQANMIIDLIKTEERKADPENHVNITSIKEGDVQVSFGSASKDSREQATEKLLYDYAKQLNRFRKLRW